MPLERNRNPPEICNPRIQGPTYRIIDYAMMMVELDGNNILENINSEGLLKQLINAKKFPMVVIRSDQGNPKEDWVIYNHLTGDKENNRSHVFVVVGYGKEMSPFSEEPLDYFLIRDSLSKIAIHRKILASNLYDLVDEIHVIEQAEKG